MIDSSELSSHSASITSTGSHVKALGYCSKMMTLVHSDFHFFSKKAECKPDETAKALPGLTWNCRYLCGFYL